MKRNVQNCVLIISLVCNLSLLSAQSFELSDLFRGSVYLAGSSPRELLFIHENSLSRKGEELTVTHTYRTPDGVPATTEEVRLNANGIQTYRLDFMNSVCGCQLENKNNTLFFSFTRGDTSRKSSRPNQPDLVTGPTLNLFIATNWDALLAGKTVFLHFPAMPLQQVVRFQLVTNTTSPYNRNGLLVITMHTANVFFRLFVEPVDLVLDIKTKRLMEIHGKSLLERKVNGKIENPVVDIYYTYK